MRFAGLILAAVLFAAGGHGQASQKQNRHGVRSESIHVHGHWVLEVRNLGGALASRHEFENSLVGPSLLASILTGGNSVGNWEILLTMASGTSPSNIFPIYQSSPCTLTNCSTPLAVTTTQSGQIILQGTTIAITSAAAGPMSSVGTYLVTCAAGTSPTSCKTTSPSSSNVTELTGASNTTYVEAGQTVTVTVTLSFS